MVVPEKGLTFKLFAGFLVNSELRLYIKASSEWKEHQILQKSTRLQLVPFEKKVYIGVYIEPAHIAIKEINQLEEEIKKSLEKLFPNFNLEPFPLYLFTQAFIQ